MYISRFKKTDRENLENLDKQLLRMVDTYSTIEEKIDRYHYQFVRNNEENIRKGALEPKYIKNALQGFLYSTSRDVKEKSIIDRILRNDVHKMISGICTSSKLQYLYRASMDERELVLAGADCIHIFALLDALSVRDFKLVDRYLEAVPGPAKTGHRMTRLLCNSVYSVLSKNEKAMMESANAIRKFNEAGTFYGAMLNAVLSIIEGSAERLEEAVGIMLKNNKKMYKPFEAMQYICIPAHAMVHLAEYTYDEVLTGFLPKIDNPYWDEEFHQAVKSRTDERIKDFCGLRGLNPVLQHWMDSLPVQFRLEDCIPL